MLRTDYYPYAVLYVASDEVSRWAFQEMTQDRFDVLTALNDQEAYRLLKKRYDRVGVLIVDYHKERKAFLARTARLYPGITRILLLGEATEEIGWPEDVLIYQCLHKPLERTQLNVAITRGLGFYVLKRRQGRFEGRPMEIWHKAMMADRIMTLHCFAMGIKHHINNALVSLKTFMKVLPEQMEKGAGEGAKRVNQEFWKDFYQDATQSIDRISGLFAELWGVSAGLPARMKDAINYDRMIQGMIQRLSKEDGVKGIQWRHRVAVRPILLVDEKKFCKIFELLLRDKILCLSPESHVTIDSRLSAEGRWLSVTITDDGPVFQPQFYRQKADAMLFPEGCLCEAGIYLMVCYFMIYHYGGVMEVVSHPKRGNCWRLTLPVRTISSDKKGA